ncbi:MAG: hypothetical protein AABW91_03510 [Nanoarchaeota archaeon]
MGITKKVQEFEREMLRKRNLSYKGLVLLEFGNQWIKKINKPAKKWYFERGVDHTSVDINGKDGSLKINLDKPFPSYLIDRFDVVTNYGTLEHVSNQYEGFKNMHNSCKINGLMIHNLVLVGHWEGHCRYFYYPSFSSSFAKLCKYEIIDSHIEKTPNKKEDLIFVCYKRTSNNFPREEEFFKLPILDTGNLEKTGNYYSLLARVKRKLKSFKIGMVLNKLLKS